MVKCSVDGCRSNSKFSSADITFHRLPDPRCFPNLYNKWLQKMTGQLEGVLDLAKLPITVSDGTARVCSLHFTEDDFAMRTDRNRTRRALKIDALPTQRLPSHELTIKSLLSSSPNVTDDRIVENVKITMEDMRGKFNNNNHPLSPPLFMDGDRFSTNGSNDHLKHERPSNNVKIKLFDHLKKKIKMEDEECHTLTISSVDNNDSRSPPPEPVIYEEDESRIPLCFRKKVDLRDQYAQVIVPLEPECGYDVMLVNENKYFMYGSSKDGSQIWRCIVKNCSARVLTSDHHCSILYGNFGVHFHMETSNVPLNMAVWSRKASGESWNEPETTEQPMDEQWIHGDSGTQPQPPALPSWPRTNQPVFPDSRFGVKDLLAPRIPPSSQLVISYDAAPPFFSSLSKFSGGQMIQLPSDPYETLRQQLNSRTLLETTGQVPSGSSQPQPPATPSPVIVSSCSMQTNEGYLPSPMSENSTALCDEGSNDSGPISRRMEEPFFQEMVGEVDVQSILQKDPLSIEDIDDVKSDDELYRQGLAEEDAAFFESLGPHLDNFGSQEKELFREKVAAIVSELTKKVASDRYLNSQ